MVDREIMINNILYVLMLGLLVAVMLIYDYAGVTVLKAGLITFGVAVLVALAARWYYTGGNHTIMAIFPEPLPTEPLPTEPVVDVGVGIVGAAATEPYGLFNPDGSRIVWEL